MSGRPWDSAINGSRNRDREQNLIIPLKRRAQVGGTEVVPRNQHFAIVRS